MATSPRIELGGQTLGGRWVAEDVLIPAWCIVSVTTGLHFTVAGCALWACTSTYCLQRPTLTTILHVIGYAACALGMMSLPMAIALKKVEEGPATQDDESSWILTGYKTF